MLLGSNKPCHLLICVIILHLSTVLSTGVTTPPVSAPPSVLLQKPPTDSCYEERNGIFPCSSTITGNFILMLFYAAVLGAAAKFISDGAEMLLDFGLPPSIIGGVVLPVMGAVPDCAIIVASGMGKDAQEKLSVGMGTLAGSTVMLLTIAWSASLYVGKCDLDKKGNAIDQTDKQPMSLTKKGVSTCPEIKSGILMMLMTSTVYLVVQSADWYWGATLYKNQPAYVRNAALATMILCVIGFCGYILFSIFDTSRTERIARLHQEEIMKRKVLHTLLQGKSIMMPMGKTPGDARGAASYPDNYDEVRRNALAKKYFKIWRNNMKARELKRKQSVMMFSDEEDDEKDCLLNDKKSTRVDVNDDDSPSSPGEEDPVKNVIKCLVLLVGGVGIVTVFSDPMCDVLTALTDKKNRSYIPIPSFYVSFIVTPFCSNASELVSSLIFASKKTRDNATMTFSQLFGAATMNNTLCLGIFTGLVYFKGLEWIYGAEIVCILLVQWIVGIISFVKTYRLWMGIPVAVTYFLCLGVVWTLEYKFGWH